VELLAALVIASVGVKVGIDSLECPLSVLELHLLLITLRGNLLLAFLLAGRCAVAAWLLLLLLTELHCELLDLLTLLRAVALGVVYQAPRTALVTARGLLRPLVTTWATTPTSRNSGSVGSGQ
jgi:hypothetical protein